MEIPKRVGRVMVITANSPEDLEAKLNVLVPEIRVRYDLLWESFRATPMGDWVHYSILVLDKGEIPKIQMK